MDPAFAGVTSWWAAATCKASAPQLSAQAAESHWRDAEVARDVVVRNPVLEVRVLTPKQQQALGRG
jgi:hypothetical protein